MKISGFWLEIHQKSNNHDFDDFEPGRSQKNKNAESKIFFHFDVALVEATYTPYCRNRIPVFETYRSNKSDPATISTSLELPRDGGSKIKSLPQKTRCFKVCQQTQLVHIAGNNYHRLVRGTAIFGLPTGFNNIVSSEKKILGPMFHPHPTFSQGNDFSCNFFLSPKLFRNSEETSQTHVAVGRGHNTSFVCAQLGVQ